MTLGDLRKKTAHMPDDTVIVTPGSDHSYDEASRVEECQAEKYKGRGAGYGEYYESEELETGSTLVTVLVIA